MAGHSITPYELHATRKWPLQEEDKERKLLLAQELVREGSLDLLDALEDNLADVAPTISTDKTRTVSCVDLDRRGDVLDMVFACDVSGEREVVRDPAEGLVVFMKGPNHTARYFSCCSVWRATDGDTGLMVVHSPWGRGGSKNQILSVLQRAVNAEDGAKAKLRANPKIPHDVLETWLANLNATKITYRKDKGIRSQFANVSGKRSAAAEMALVVKGTETLPYRDALKRALQGSTNRDKLFTVEMREAGDAYADETFDDVEVSITHGDGRSTTYSIGRDTVPTMGFDYTKELSKVYLALPEEDDGDWPVQLRKGATPFMDKVLDLARQGN